MKKQMGLFLAKHPVTWKQYLRFCEDTRREWQLRVGVLVLAVALTSAERLNNSPPRYIAA